MSTKSKSCYLDSNLLVYYSNLDSPHHKKAVDLILQLQKLNFTFYLSPLCLDEFIHTLNNIHYLNHKRRLSLQETTEILQSIFSFPSLTIINPPTSMQSQFQIPKLMEKFKLHPRDAYHLLTVRHHKIKYLATFDSDFKLVFEHSPLKPFTV